MARPRRSRAAQRQRDADPTGACDLVGCEEPQARSLPAKRLQGHFGAQKLGSRTSGNLALCKTHYKEYKKSSKDERKNDRSSWDY